MSNNEFTITSVSGNITAVILSYGGIISHLYVNHPNGKTYDIVCGHKTENDYKKDADTRMGAIIGRHLGRINGSEFTLNGKKYTLSKNNNDAHLHGTFNSVYWEKKEQTEHSLTLFYKSPAGEDGFPGNLEVKTSYAFEGEKFTITTEAATDEDTIFSPSNHSYFNLGENETVYEDTLTIPSNKAFEIDEFICKTGRIIDVLGTPLDFTAPRKIKESMGRTYSQTAWAKGIDHTYLFEKGEATASVETPSLKLSVSTTEKGIHVYSSGSLGECKVEDRNGKAFKQGGAVCFETERIAEGTPYPVLKKGEPFFSKTIWEISTKL